MKRRLIKKKSSKTLTGRSGAWTHIVQGSPVLLTFPQLWDEKTIDTWKEYYDRKFRALNPENDFRCRIATMFHYIDKRARRYYNRATKLLLRSVISPESLTASAVQVFLENDPLTVRIGECYE